MNVTHSETCIAKNQTGFTLVELLVVLTILGIISVIAVPSVMGQIDEADRRACVANRQIILTGWYQTKALTGVTLPDYLVSGDPYLDGTDCPSHGVFTAEGGIITCSKHGDIGTTEPTTSGVESVPSTPETSLPEVSQPEVSEPEEPTVPTFPGTDLPIYDNIWPKQEEFEKEWDQKTLSPSGIFMYEGAYYVIARTLTINKPQAASGPGGETNGWYATEKLTGTILTATDFHAYGGTDKCDYVTRGDLYYDETSGCYYVFNVGGNIATKPTVSDKQWYLIP